ncbi:MAG: GNAT family protein [Pseudomonadota bacterium]
MRLLKFAQKEVDSGVIRTDNLLLRRPEMDDYIAWARLRTASADFLRPYEPLWTSDEHTRHMYRQRMRRQEADINKGTGMPWFIFDLSNPEQLMGGLTLSNIRRGVSQTGTLGYWMGEPFAGQGHMREAVLGVCKWAFYRNDLHRIEAATVKDNHRSQRVLLGCGFEREGEARQYLRINGEWRDHILFAKILG